MTVVSSDELLQLLEGKQGVLPYQHLRRAIDARWIDAGGFVIPEENVQPASVDLRLGERAYRIRCSFLPDDQRVDLKVKDFIIDELNLHNEGVVLETNRPYLIPLKERLALPPAVRGRCNPKSSTGRADVFTRVITDGSHRFDDVRPVLQVTFAINYAISHYAPWSWHVVNLAIHLATSMMVFLCVRDHLWWPRGERGLPQSVEQP